MWNKERITGFNTNTKKNLIMGAGAFFRNFVVGVDTYASAKAAGKCIGATRGGGTFNAIPTIRNLPFDGVVGEANIDSIDGWDISMVANVVELSPELMYDLIPGSDVDAGDGTDDYITIQGTNYIDEEDYIDTITFIGKSSQNSLPIIIQIENVLVTTGVAINAQDKNEVVIPVTFKARYDASDLDHPPFTIYWPKVEALVPTSIVLAKGGSNPVDGPLVQPLIPLNGETDATGSVDGWVTSTKDKIKITVTDASPATSTITINAAPYTSGADYTIAAVGTLTVVITTSETGMRDCVRTLSIAVTA